MAYPRCRTRCGAILGGQRFAVSIQAILMSLVRPSKLGSSSESTTYTYRGKTSVSTLDLGPKDTARVPVTRRASCCSPVATGIPLGPDCPPRTLPSTGFGSKQTDSCEASKNPPSPANKPNVNHVQPTPYIDYFRSIFFKKLNVPTPMTGLWPPVIKHVRNVGISP